MPAPDSLFREPHAVINIHLTFGDVGQFLFDQLPLQRREVISKQFAFEVIILVLDDAGGHTIILFLMLVPVEVNVADPDDFGTVYFGTDTGNTETAFFKTPVLAVFFYDFRINKYFF